MHAEDRQCHLYGIMLGSFWLLPLALIALHLPMPASGASAQLLRGTVKPVNGQSVTLSIGLGQQKRTFVSSSHERNPPHRNQHQKENCQSLEEMR